MNGALYQHQLTQAAHLAARIAPELRADFLYAEWYAPLRAGSAPRLSPPVALAHYRAADATALRFTSGWTTAGGIPASGHLLVHRGAESRAAHPLDFCPVGGQLSLRQDSTELSGWWATFAPPSPQGEAAVRVYWSVLPGSVFRLVQAITTQLPPLARYSLKAPIDLQRCLRPDGVVLYLEREQWNELAPLLRTLAESVAAWLHPSHPAFTLPLAPGVSLAEDVPGESFGGQRCRWLAEAFATSTNPAAMQSAAQALLTQQGIDWHAPYRNPGSQREYPW